VEEYDNPDETDNVVNAPDAAVVPPIAPGLAKVAPLKEEAFKLATLVVEVTDNGAVPVAIVDANDPEVVTVPVKDGLASSALLVFKLVKFASTSVDSNADPLTLLRTIVVILFLV
jgi:hypothetical protein